MDNEWKDFLGRIDAFGKIEFKDIPVHEDRISFELLSDDLFVKMMLDFSDEVVVSGAEEKSMRKEILFNAREFNADAFVMHKFFALWLDRHEYVMPDFNKYDDHLTKCRMFGINTRLFNDYDLFPYNKVLMIRQDEPVPKSRLVNFKNMI